MCCGVRTSFVKSAHSENLLKLNYVAPQLDRGNIRTKLGKPYKKDNKALVEIRTRNQIKWIGFIMNIFLGFFRPVLLVRRQFACEAINCSAYPTRRHVSWRDPLLATTMKLKLNIFKLIFIFKFIGYIGTWGSALKGCDRNVNCQEDGYYAFHADDNIKQESFINLQAKWCPNCCMYSQSRMSSYSYVR